MIAVALMITEPDSIAASHLCEAAAAAATASHDTSGPSARLLQAQCSWPIDPDAGQFWRTEHQGTSGTAHKFLSLRGRDFCNRARLMCSCSCCSPQQLCHVLYLKLLKIGRLNYTSFITTNLNPVVILLWEFHKLLHVLLHCFHIR